MRADIFVHLRGISISTSATCIERSTEGVVGRSDDPTDHQLTTDGKYEAVVYCEDAAREK